MPHSLSTEILIRVYRKLFTMHANYMYTRSAEFKATLLKIANKIQTERILYI
jgi:hypothetical protein